MSSFFAILSTIVLILDQTSAFPTAIAYQNVTAATYSPIFIATADDFFTHFTSYTGVDPTHGFVNYTDMDFALEQGYLSKPFLPDLNASAARLSMDDTRVSTNGRNSVRLLSKANFTVGSLFVLDVAHVPVAWGQWSSFWLLGQDGIWPSSGEIDVFESVHMNAGNTITLHTAEGCTVTNSSESSGTLIQTDCNAGNGMQGCSTIAPPIVKVFNDTVKTAGQPFNSNDGAVFVTEWTTTGITVWMFNREAVPYTLTTEHPSTADFPRPVASFGGQGCSFDKAFREMQLIINIDACGDWAGQVWESSGAAAATNASTCADYVSQNPGAMKDAYFDFLSLVVYSSA